MKRLALALSAFALVACSFLTAPPADVVHDSCSALQSACDFYAHSHTAKHTAEADRACAHVAEACEPVTAGSGGASSLDE